MSARIGIIAEDTLITTYLFGQSDPFKIGCILKSSYKKSPQIKELMSFGDIVELKNNTLESIFFSRDRGEPEEACKSYEEYADSLESINTSTSAVDHYFIYFQNKWYYTKSFTNEWIDMNRYLLKIKRSKK